MSKKVLIAVWVGVGVVAVALGVLFFLNRKKPAELPSTTVVPTQTEQIINSPSGVISPTTEPASSEENTGDIVEEEIVE